MKTHKIHITEKQIKVLEELLKKDVYIISAPSLNISTEDKIMESSYFYMPYLSENIIGSKQLKTFKFRSIFDEEDDVDFFRMEFAIKRNENELKNKFDQYVFQNMNSSISFAPSSPIEKIQVLTYKYIYESTNPTIESVKVDYDDALLFFQENGKKFMLACVHSCTSYSQFIRNDTTINEKIKDLYIRKEIKNDR